MQSLKGQRCEFSKKLVWEILSKLYFVEIGDIQELRLHIVSLCKCEGFRERVEIANLSIDTTSSHVSSHPKDGHKISNSIMQCHSTLWSEFMRLGSQILTVDIPTWQLRSPTQLCNVECIWTYQRDKLDIKTWTNWAPKFCLTKAKASWLLTPLQTLGNFSGNFRQLCNLLKDDLSASGSCPDEFHPPNVAQQC